MCPFNFLNKIFHCTWKSLFLLVSHQDRLVSTTTTSSFYMSAGDLKSSLTVTWQVLYPLNSHPSPKNQVYKAVYAI